MNICTPPERVLIAERSTRGSGLFEKRRWTEIRLWFAAGAREPYVLQTRGCSSIKGEHAIRVTKRSDTLAGILARLGDSAPEASIKRQALAWEENAHDR
jgi:hypothetical protein